MAETLGQLGTDALSELGVLAAGETMSASDGALVVRVANRLVDLWAAKRLMIYSSQLISTWTIVSGTQTYTVGAFGTIPVIRPDFINEIHFKDTAPTPNVEYPLRKYSDEDWQRVTLKTMQAVFPLAWVYSATYPLGTLTLWPVPTSGTLQGLLYAPSAIAVFPDTNTSIDLPPGYREAIVTNLAVMLAPSYTTAPKPQTVQMAEDALRTIMAVNYRPVELAVEASLLGAGGRRQLSYYIRSGN